MPQLTERDAERLSPEQATALVRVIEFQAKWDGLLAEQGQKISDLHARQKANDAYQAVLREYRAKYRNASIPEPTHAVLDRLVVWCRTLRVVFGRAEAESPIATLGKVYRLVDRVAARMNKEPLARTPAADLLGAMRELDVVVAWCETLVPPAPVRKLKSDQAAEITSG
jgi:hypothetical protein